MNSVTGAFIARGAVFSKNSVVNINIPRGDIIISANQKIETTVRSIYAATPPTVSTKIPPTLAIAATPPTQITIQLSGRNFRNIIAGDLNLLVPNGTCAPPSNAPGLSATDQTISFVCQFGDGIKSAGSVSGTMLLSYFGGNLLSTLYTLTFSTSFGQSTSILSATVAPISKPRPSSGLGCGASSIQPTLPPGNVCAVAAATMQQQNVPEFSASNADTVVAMFPANSNPAPNSFKFSSSAARSITLGSYQYSIGSPLSDYATPQQNPKIAYNTVVKSIASCPIAYNPQNPVTYGRIASRNPNFNIPYEEQQNLLYAVEMLYNGNVSFVIVKVNGGGTNLPGYFTLALQPIYNVRVSTCHV